MDFYGILQTEVGHINFPHFLAHIISKSSVAWFTYY